MWPFSDKDFDDVENAAKLDFPFLSEEKRLKFLEGFEDGWKRTKNWKWEVDVDTVHKLFLSLKDGIDKDPWSFGQAFGWLVALFRFGSIQVTLKIANWGPESLKLYTNCVNQLRDKPYFHKIILKRVKIWAKKLDPSQLRPQDKEAIEVFLKRLR